MKQTNNIGLFKCGYKLLIKYHRLLNDDEIYWFYNNKTNKGYYHRLIGTHPDNYEIRFDLKDGIYKAIKFNNSLSYGSDALVTFNIYSIESGEEKNKAKLLLL